MFANKISGAPEAPPDPTGAGQRRGWVAALVPLVVLGVGTLVFWLPGVDLAVSERFYGGPAQGWVWKNQLFFSLLYKYGTIPAAALAVVALIVLLAGLVFAPALPWRKLSAYYLLVVIIAPGILINAVFKEHWGRPRPRDVGEFDGRYRFEQVWEYDAASPGKSFPSGHASMGFCLLALYFVGRALRRRWAVWAAVTAVALGLALGLARIAQGGHFASDVLWSAGFCYLTALGLARLMRIGGNPFYRGEAMSKTGWAALGIGALAAVVLTVGVPYQDEKSLEASGVKPGELVTIDVELGRAELLVAGGEHTLFTSHVEAFGMFGSELRDEWDGAADGSVKFRQQVKGSFAMVEQPATLSVSTGSGGGKMKVEVAKGSVVVELFEGEWDWRVAAPGGDIELRVPAGMEIKVSRESVGGTVANSVPGLEWAAEKGRWKRGDKPSVKVRVATDGDLRLVPLNR